MSSSFQFIVNDTPIIVSRKRIKHMYLRVSSPGGQVTIAAPLKTPEKAIVNFVSCKWSWIKKRQEKLAREEKFLFYQYISGETHLFQGLAYTLNVMPTTGRSKVILREPMHIDLYAPSNSEMPHRELILQKWYRQQMKHQVPGLIAKWEAVIGIKIATWHIKKMKTNWGTCNVNKRRIWLNLELIKKPLPCLEYIIVHEIVHLLERSHNARFAAFMDKFMPTWREHKKQLHLHLLA